MVRKIKKIISKHLGITKVLENQRSILKFLDEYKRQNNELIKANIFNSSIVDSNWLKYKNFSPGNWAVDYSLLYTLFRILSDYEPKNIIEFGLGQSSKLIHQYGNFFTDVNAITIEHDIKWLDYFKNHINDSYPLSVIQKELKAIKYKGNETLSYSGMDDVLKDKKYDLILIDGTYGSKNYSRPHILNYLPECLTNSFCIILDDYNRLGEKETNNEILDILNYNNIDHLNAINLGIKEHSLICSSDLSFLTTI